MSYPAILTGDRWVRPSSARAFAALRAIAAQDAERDGTAERRRAAGGFAHVGFAAALIAAERVPSCIPGRYMYGCETEHGARAREERRERIVARGREEAIRSAAEADRRHRAIWGGVYRGD